MQGDTQNAYDSSYPAVQEVTSREYDNLVLLYGTSRTEEISALAFRVYRTQRRWERAQNPPSLDAQGGTNDTLDFGYFGPQGHSEDVSQPGNEIFRIESERNQTIIEYGFEVEPDGVLTAVQTADGSPILGLRRGAERARGFGPSAFSERGAVDSSLTRVDSPEELATTALSPNPDRQGLFRIDSKEEGRNPFRFGFANTTNGSVTVDVTGYGVAYDVRPIHDEDTVLDMLTPDGTPARRVTYGGFENTNPNLPRGWYDDRVTVDISEVNVA